MICYPCCILLLSLGSTNRARSDWPEFRGPLQNGHSTALGLPTRWSDTENVVWFAKTTGLGWSSPVVAGDRVYFTTAISAEAGESGSPVATGRQRLQLVCLNARDGKEIFCATIFEQPEDAPKIHNKNSHASPTPIVHGNRVYVHFGHQGTACTDLNGKVLWENREHAYPPTHGNGGSPILVDGKLILTCDGGDQPYTLCLDAESGRELWRTKRDASADKPFSFCTPQLIEVNGKKQIVSPGTNVVQSLSPDDGRVLWYVQYDGYSVVPRPVYYRGLVLVCTGFGKTKLLAIDPTGTGDVTDTHLKWTFGTSVPQTPSVVCFGDQVVMTSDGGIATSVDIANGAEKWRKRLGGNYSASPLLSGDTLFFQSEQGEALVFKTGDDLQEISRNQLPGRVFASYAIVDQDLIVRAENGVYRIGMR
ncbi:MAG: PQQ-binding-like beta-propeller repeat protein [Pirellula sp.]